MTNKDTQKDWFYEGAYPTDTQFHEVIGSSLGVLDTTEDLPMAGAGNHGDEYKIGNTFYKCELSGGRYSWVPKSTATPTNSYDDLTHKPTINDVLLSGKIEDIDSLGALSKNTGKYDAAENTDITSDSVIYIKGASKWLKTTLGELVTALNLVTTTALASFRTEVLQAAANQTASALDNKIDKDFSNITESGIMSDSAYLPVVIDGSMHKVKAEIIAVYTGTKNKVESSSLEVALKNQRTSLTISGTQNGTNRVFSISPAYRLGTSAVYLNGNRLYAGTAYIEDNSTQITFINAWTPASTDIIIFEAIPLPVDAISNNTSQNQ